MSTRNCRKIESKEDEAAKEEVVLVQKDDYLKHSNELVELTKTRLMRAFVESQGPSSKIVFVENKTLKSTLLEEIDESQLLDIYGGKLPLVPI